MISRECDGSPAFEDFVLDGSFPYGIVVSIGARDSEFVLRWLEREPSHAVSPRTGIYRGQPTQRDCQTSPVRSRGKTLRKREGESLPLIARDRPSAEKDDPGSTSCSHPGRVDSSLAEQFGDIATGTPRRRADDATHSRPTASARRC